MCTHCVHVQFVQVERKSVYALSEIHESRICSGLSYKISHTRIYKVVLTFCVSHRNTHSFLSTGEKNVIEETGERCNENSSWRGCTPLHTSKAQLLALEVGMQTLHRYIEVIDTPVPRH